MSNHTVETLKKRLTEMVLDRTDKEIDQATGREVYESLAAIVNEEINPQWQATKNRYNERDVRQVYYLSMEFLIGTLIESNLLNSGMLDRSNKALTELGFEPDSIYNYEHDAGLGNGGLGRLAACFLDSLASLNFAGHGFGIRYRYGLFEQRIIHGNQVELPDNWLRDPYPWETRQEQDAVRVRFGGEVQMNEKQDGHMEVNYRNTDIVRAVPYDVPVVGYDNEVINTLRLFSAEPAKDLTDSLEDDDSDKYHGLSHDHDIEQISGFLYPDDSLYEGKELRLKQEYFLVSASLQNIIRSYKENYSSTLEHIADKVVIQINDTHPSLAVPEFMRLLMDEEGFGWDEAWSITTRVMAYTNHTVLVEAFEKWPVNMMKEILPRMFMIIDEINERFCKEVYDNHPELRDHIGSMAIVAYDQVHMAHLAIVGSFSVNGVAALHTKILKTEVMPDFYAMFPNRFNNKTNGITHRRWLLQSNPKLADLISEKIGSDWIKRPNQLIHLLKYTTDQAFLERMDEIKTEKKRKLADVIYKTTGIKVDENSIFDVHIKRLHEYKRQLLKVFHIMYLYHELKDNPEMDITPRTFIFGAKAAPSYHLAKEVIRLINKVAQVINNDKSIDGKLKVVFIENYNVSLAERIIPAADISEQISTAGKEASGTGNMKMMMNGALTVGTLDGANVEIRKAVGDNNIFIFGLTADEVLDYVKHGGYSAMGLYHSDDRIKRILDELDNGFGSDSTEFKDIYYNLLYHNDPYFVLKDFEAYLEAHENVERTYRDRTKWLKKSLTNIAYSGRFSSDRTINEYAAEIWKIKPILK